MRNNVVACVNCKTPVLVTALNAIRCKQCNKYKRGRLMRTIYTLILVVVFMIGIIIGATVTTCPQAQPVPSYDESGNYRGSAPQGGGLGMGSPYAPGQFGQSGNPYIPQQIPPKYYGSPC